MRLHRKQMLADNAIDRGGDRDVNDVNVFNNNITIDFGTLAASSPDCATIQVDVRNNEDRSIAIMFSLCDTLTTQYNLSLQSIHIIPTASYRKLGHSNNGEGCINLQEWFTLERDLMFTRQAKSEGYLFHVLILFKIFNSSRILIITFNLFICRMVVCLLKKETYIQKLPTFVSILNAVPEIYSHQLQSIIQCDSWSPSKHITGL